MIPLIKTNTFSKIKLKQIQLIPQKKKKKKTITITTSKKKKKNTIIKLRIVIKNLVVFFFFFWERKNLVVQLTFPNISNRDIQCFDKASSSSDFDANEESPKSLLSSSF